VGAIRSERRAASDRNGWAAYVGIRKRSVKQKKCGIAAPLTVGTVSSRFYRWHAAGVWLRIRSALQAQVDARGEVDWNLHFVDATVIRAHQHAAGARRTGDAEGGENVEALGRSQGGLSTKLHLHAEGLGKLSGDIRGAGHKRHQNPSTRLPTLFRKPFSRQGTPAEAGNRVDGFQMSPADGSPKSPDRQADHGRADGRLAARAGRAGSAAGWWCGPPSRPRGRPRLRPRRLAGDKGYSSPTTRRRLRRAAHPAGDPQQEQPAPAAPLRPRSLPPTQPDRAPDQSPQAVPPHRNPLREARRQLPRHGHARHDPALAMTTVCRHALG